jgi:regulator of RNase E activity RraA
MAQVASTEEFNVDYKFIKKRLYTAVLSDTLDELGMTAQTLPSAIRPLDEASVVVGRARTGLYMDVYHVAPDENPYELEIALIDDLGEDDVCVLCCNGSQRVAPWGELLSTAAQVRRAAGCITDGLVRDIRRIREMGFPVFHAGIRPVDSKGRGKIMAIDVAVEIGGVRVMPGDLVFADADGVVVVPGHAVERVVAAALKKVESESKTRMELLEGRTLRQVYDRYGVL